MTKWLLHSYLQVALNLPATRLSASARNLSQCICPHPVSAHSARTPSQDVLKLLVRLGNSEIMFSFVEGKTVWRIIGESVEDVRLFREGNTQRIENWG